MEEIIALFIVLVVWVISAVLENKKEANKSATSGNENKQPPLGEQFPAVEVFNEILEKEKSKRQKVKPAPANGNVNSIMSRLLSNGKNNEKKKTESFTEEKEEVKEQPKQHCRYAITGKSEAKRAFIYSEIFNRKY